MWEQKLSYTVENCAPGQKLENGDFVWRTDIVANTGMGFAFPHIIFARERQIETNLQARNFHTVKRDTILEIQMGDLPIVLQLLLSSLERHELRGKTASDAVSTLFWWGYDNGLDAGRIKEWFPVIVSRREQVLASCA